MQPHVLWILNKCITIVSQYCHHATCKALEFEILFTQKSVKCRNKKVLSGDKKYRSSTFWLEKDRGTSNTLDCYHLVKVTYKLEKKGMSIE